MTEGHTHQIKHFCSNQQKVGVQGGECATPTTCDAAKLERAGDLLQRILDVVSATEAEDEVPVPDWFQPEIGSFLASLSPSRSSAGNGYDGRGKTVAAGPHRPGNEARTPGGAEDASAEGGRE